MFQAIFNRRKYKFLSQLKKSNWINREWMEIVGSPRLQKCWKH